MSFWSGSLFSRLDTLAHPGRRAQGHSRLAVLEVVGVRGPDPFCQEVTHSPTAAGGGGVLITCTVAALARDCPRPQRCCLGLPRRLC